MTPSRKNISRRNFLATPAGVKQWEADCKFPHPQDAASKLGVPIRTYFRWKAEGLPSQFQREMILDRMEAALPRKLHG